MDSKYVLYISPIFYFSLLAEHLKTQTLSLECKNYPDWRNRWGKGTDLHPESKAGAEG